MPVINPKTGEQDYVDINRVSKIILDPITVFNLQNPADKLKISFDFRAEGEKEVSLVATPGSAKNEQVNLKMPLLELEELLSKCFHSEKNLRLEHIDVFKNRMNKLVTNIIHENKKINNFYVENKVKNKSTLGIGLIIDEKVQREVGTFEQVELTYDSNVHALFTLPFLQGKVPSDIKNDPTGYIFVFYSLDENVIFYIKPKNITYEENGVDIRFFSTDVGVDIEYGFSEKHSKYSIVSEAENSKLSKDILESIDLDDGLSKIQFDSYRASRLEILKDSQERAKKEKIANQFADIELF